MRVTGPLFKWFGSKWQGSKHYPAPQFSVIAEPFAGSAGYSLRWGAEKTVLIAESNPNLQKLWCWLIGPDSTEAAIREIPIGVKEGTDIRDLGLSDGQALLLKHWQRTNNVGPSWTISPWGNKPGQWTANTRARVAEEVSAVKRWRFFDSERGLFLNHNSSFTLFVDPPYQYNYQYGSAPIDYQELGIRLRSLSLAQLIVCEADCAKTGRRPSWLPFEPFRKQVTSRRKEGNSTHSSELLYYAPARQEP